MGRDDWDDGVIMEDEEPRLRPFVVTKGRTASQDSVRVETLVEPSNGQIQARFEKKKLLDRTLGKAISVAELSAHLGLPIGTTMTLVSEMIDEGMLKAHSTLEDTSGEANIDIMTRIINRVREL